MKYRWILEIPPRGVIFILALLAGGRGAHASDVQKTLCSESGAISKAWADEQPLAAVDAARRVIEHRLEPTCWVNAIYLLSMRGRMNDWTLLRDFVLKGEESTSIRHGASGVGHAIHAIGRIAGRYSASQREAEKAVAFLAECSRHEFWKEKSSWRDSTKGLPYTFGARACVNALGYIDLPASEAALRLLLKSAGLTSWEEARVSRSLERRARIREAGGTQAYLDSGQDW